MSKPSLSEFLPPAPPPPKPEKPQGEQIINMTFRLPRSKWKMLAALSADERRPIQHILLDAVEAEFARRGLPF